MKLQRFLPMLSVLAIPAVLAPVTGNNNWLSFLSFLTFLLFSKVKSDERFKINMNKAARNGFVASMLCWAGLAFFLSYTPDIGMLIQFLVYALFLITVIFAISFALYDKKEF